MKKVLFILFMCLCFSFNLDALCYDDDLNNWALDVQIKQIEFNNKLPNELNDNKPLKETMDYAYILSLSDYRADVVMKGKLTFKREDDSIYTEDLEWIYIPGHKVWGIPNYNAKGEVNYDINIYGDKDSNCPGELIKTIKYKIEPFNFYLKTEYCEQYPDAPMCEMYKDTSDVTKEEFEEIMDEYIEEHSPEKKKTLFDSLFEYIKQYAVYILIPFIFISIFYILRIIKVNKEEKNK